MQIVVQDSRPEPSPAQVVKLAIGLFLVAVAVWAAGLRPVPSCQEDAALVGVGGFESGRWSGYECGPSVDDYDPAR